MRHVLMVLVTTFLGVTFGIPAPSANAQPGVEVDWVANYSSGESPDFAFARKVAVDGSGNVYVTGSSYAANGMPAVSPPATASIDSKPTSRRIVEQAKSTSVRRSRG